MKAASALCCLRVLLSQWRVRFWRDAGAVARCPCKGAASGCTSMHAPKRTRRFHTNTFKQHPALHLAAAPCWGTSTHHSDSSAPLQGPLQVMLVGAAVTLWNGHLAWWCQSPAAAVRVVCAVERARCHSARVVLVLWTSL